LAIDYRHPGNDLHIDPRDSEPGNSRVHNLRQGSELALRRSGGQCDFTRRRLYPTIQEQQGAPE
jgi:hypothetical protein